MLGTSGSDASDMRTVLRKIEAGIIDTTISLWAITGNERVAGDFHQRRDEPYRAQAGSWPFLMMQMTWA